MWPNSRTHGSWKNGICEKCSCFSAVGCCCDVVVMRSSFSMFHNKDSQPVSYSFSLHPPCSNHLLAWWKEKKMEGREEQKRRNPHAFFPTHATSCASLSSSRTPSLICVAMPHSFPDHTVSLLHCHTCTPPVCLPWSMLHLLSIPTLHAIFQTPLQFPCILLDLCYSPTPCTPYLSSQHLLWTPRHHSWPILSTWFSPQSLQIFGM